MVITRTYRHRDGLFANIIKVFIFILLLIAVASAAAVIYFNGDNVKAPLLKILTERSGTAIKAEKIEFSALYPDTLKLYKVNFGNSHIDEVYVEYDLTSLWSKDLLHIKDLYFKGITPDQNDITAFSSRNLGFASISIDKFTLVDANIPYGPLTATRLDLKTNDLILTKGKTPTFKDGKILLQEGKFKDFELKSLSANLENDQDRILFKKLKARLLGGSIAGELEFRKDTELFNFSQLQLNGIIIRNFSDFKRDLKLHADRADFSRVAVDLNEQGLYLGEVSGTFDNLTLGEDTLNGRFEGDLGEISAPKLGLTASMSQGRAIFLNNGVTAELTGQTFEGTYGLKFNLSDFNSPKLNVKELNLEDCMIEPDDAQYDLFKQETAKSNLNIDLLHLKNVGLLSHIGSLPVSIKRINGTITKINAHALINPWLNYEGFAQIDLDELMYSDLFMRKILMTASVSDSLVSLNVPLLQFVNSNLNFSASYDRQRQSGYLLGKAFDFELSELNCNLNSRLMAGKVNVDIDIKSSGNPFDLSKADEGSLRVKGDKLMISSLGLDLINGGTMQSFNMSLSELLTALNDADCGMDSAELKADFSEGEAKLAFNSSLTTAYVSGNGTLNFRRGTSAVKATFISHPKDSITTLEVTGQPLSPKFSITPISRGENRPGLTPNLNR